MASVIRDGGSPSEEAFMIEVVQQYHPEFINLPAAIVRREIDLARRGMYQMSALLEETVSIRSKLIRDVPLVNTDAVGMDFTDGSDLKSCTLSYGKNGSTPQGGQHYALTGSISGLKNKGGSIRVILWNDLMRRVEYYYLPSDVVQRMASNKSPSIRLSANIKTGIVTKLQPYRCKTFDELVLM